MAVLALARAADPLCEEGYSEHDPQRPGDACCPISCGQCGGTGCFNLPGGRENCCTSYVHRANLSCNTHDPPCVVHGDPSPAPPPPLPPAPTNVTVRIGNSIVSETDDRYVGWTIDLSSGRQFFQLDFTNATLRYLASQLPNFVRVGGSGQDYIDYDFEGKGCNGVGAQPGLCLNTTQWDALYSFIVGTGSKMVFGLNACQRATQNGSGRRLTICDSAAGAWDAAKAESLLRYAVAHDQEIFGVELGNERNGQVKASDQAKDFVILDELLGSVYGSSESRPKLFGPDPHSFKESTSKWPDIIDYIEEFIESVTAAGVHMHGITHHEYIEVEVVDEPHNFNDPAVLNRTSDIAALFNDSVSRALPTARKWVGEIGPHNGGTHICNHDQMRWANFADTIWYSDSLAAKALHGYHVYTRQDFVGIDYGLIDCVDHTPLPDYYTAVLFHRLMGPKVLKASVFPADPGLRTYAHCSRTSGKASLLLVHLREKKPQKVTLEGMKDVQAYVLTAAGGDYLSTGAQLNGKLLKFTDKRLPKLNGVSIDVRQPFYVPPLSVTFLEFSGPAAGPCCTEMIV